MDILSTLFQQQSRRIGLIVPSVVISEKHDDSLEITEHPVEVGAAISDHAFRRPSEVVMQVGFAGGGSLLLRGMIERGNKVAFPIFVEDIHANARGYELLYQSEVAANGQQ